jgi:hypothetical protein
MTDELEDKKKFAAELLRNPQQPFVAALAVYPDNNNWALFVATHWPQDADVLKFQQEILKDHPETDFLPTEAELARAIWDKMNAKFTPIEDFTKLGKLYAEIRGFIKKTDTNITVNANTDNRVMVVKDLGTDEEWENKASKQQQALLNVSTSKH